MKHQSNRCRAPVFAAIVVGLSIIAIHSAEVVAGTHGNPGISGVASGDQGQTQTVTFAFACRLAVQVLNGSAPVQGATVVFASPPVGASALLTDTTTFGSQLTETTDSNGMASVIAIADVVPGNYAVTATLTSSGSGLAPTPLLLATYPMSNLAIGEQLMANGFEGDPALCGSFAE